MIMFQRPLTLAMALILKLSVSVFAFNNEGDANIKVFMIMLLRMTLLDNGATIIVIGEMVAMLTSRRKTDKFHDTKSLLQGKRHTGSNAGTNWMKQGDDKRWAKKIFHEDEPAEAAVAEFPLNDTTMNVTAEKVITIIGMFGSGRRLLQQASHGGMKHVNGM